MKEQTDFHASSSEYIAKLLKPDDKVWVKLEKQGKPLCLVFDSSIHMSNNDVGQESTINL
jgi:hypothetical protein